MDYVITNKNERMHFYIENHSIKLLEKGCESPKILLKSVKEPFCAFYKDGIYHIIGVNNKNEIIYIPYKNDLVKFYVLCKLNGDIKVKRILLSGCRKLINLTYSAEYNKETLLVHCILGNNAKPSVIDKIIGDWFWIWQDKVYYTNRYRNMGFQDLSCGKPCRFVNLEGNAKFPYAASFDKKEYFLYIKDNKIILNNQIITDDKNAEMAIVVPKKEISVFWKSGDVVRYLIIKDGKQGRIISTCTPRLCVCQNSDNIYCDYLWERRK